MESVHLCSCSCSSQSVTHRRHLARVETGLAADGLAHVSLPCLPDGRWSGKTGPHHRSSLAYAMPQHIDLHADGTSAPAAAL